MIFRGLGADGAYWSGLTEGELRLPRCRGCGHWHWPAVSRCGACGSWTHDWHSVPLRGNLFTWTRTWHRFLGAEGFETPFVTVVVELPAAGGRRVLGVLEDGEEPRIGAPLKGVVRGTPVPEGEIPSLRWRIASSAEA